MLCYKRYYLKQRSVNSLTALYNIRSLNVSCNAIKERIWDTMFGMPLIRDNWLFYIVVFLLPHEHFYSYCFMFFVMFLYCCTLYVCFLCVLHLCVINDEINSTVIAFKDRSSITWNLYKTQRPISSRYVITGVYVYQVIGPNLEEHPKW